ncbi:MAG TPA: HlyD family efflux transporter periplasmic adaptor subunit [Ferruginibacter sp.]|nr:HlyD family efflux transporter periplasmic adaptor subunit [Ferruginibacter sp.]
MPYGLKENSMNGIDENKSSGNQLLRSSEVSEIISHKPGFLIRWGITIFFVLLLLIVASTFFIHYPDIVSAKAKLTSTNAPKEVKTKTAGKIVKLNATEGKFVRQGELLGFMESQANHYEVIMLSQTIDSLQVLINHNLAEAVPKYLLKSYQNMGEVQPSYQSFMQGFILFKQYLSAGYYLKKKAMLQADLIYLRRLHANFLQQKEMQQEDLGLAKETFDANSILKNEKVISPLDFRNEKSKYISKEMNIPQITSSIISNESDQHEKQKEILQLENEIAQQKNIFSQALNTLKSQLDEWKSKYLLIAPVNGKIAFAGFIQENQQVRDNQTICFINPENTSYYAEVYVPQNNFGKVKEGQKILLKLPSYPFQEYGAIEGSLVFISHIATDSGYIAKVILPNGLRTNYKKQIQYRDGLIAQGEIITDDLQLSDRLMNSIKQVIKR